MKIIKSTLFAIFILFLITSSIALIIKCFRSWKTKIAIRKYIIYLLCFSSAAFLCITSFGEYVYPFERTLRPSLFAELTVPEKYELEYPGQKFWHGAYEAFGFYAESFYFDPDERRSIYGFGWPPMDYKNHCYIITYGQKIESLTYNVWDTIDTPIRTGAKVGHMILSDEFSPEKIYIYELPKIRIENDINNTIRDTGHGTRDKGTVLLSPKKKDDFQA